MDFSLWQVGIVLVIALLVFGPKRLPDLAKSLGSGMKEFKDSITGESKSSPDDGDTVAKSLGSGVEEFKDSMAHSDDDEDADEAEAVPIEGSADEEPEVHGATAATKS